MAFHSKKIRNRDQHIQETERPDKGRQKAPARIMTCYQNLVFRELPKKDNGRFNSEFSYVLF